MDDTQLIGLITTSVSNFGFPIVITAYLLIRFERRIDTLNSTFIELHQAIKEEAGKKKL